MRSLQVLLADLCPNGVPKIKLGELEDKSVLQLGRGDVISKTTLNKDPGYYPVYSSSAVANGLFGRYGNFMFDDERITWSIDGGGKFFYRAAHKYSVTNVCGWLKILQPDVLNTRFLYFALIEAWGGQTYNYTLKAHPSVIRENYSIPLPPIEVQLEIIRILDAFIMLEVELEAELEARKKQYSYYVKELTTEISGSGAIPLSKVFDFRNGYTPLKSNSLFWEKGTIPWFRLEDIKKNGRILSSAIQTVDESALKGSGSFPENSLIISVSATIGEHALVTVPFLANQRFIILTIKSDLKDQLLAKYAFYCGYDISNFCKNNTTLGNFAGVDMKKFGAYKIQIPSLEYQNRCVEMLDAFADLISSVESELDLRRKQYSYYRAKLLNFQELLSA